MDPRIRIHTKMSWIRNTALFRWYLFRSWGRVGTTIGGTKLEDFEDKHEALRSFEFLYEEKTGNKWKNRKDFKKVSIPCRNLFSVFSNRFLPFCSGLMDLDPRLPLCCLG
jgi:predicted DNA-binding WGR domain protein